MKSTERLNEICGTTLWSYSVHTKNYICLFKGYTLHDFYLNLAFLKTGTTQSLPAGFRLFVYTATTLRNSHSIFMYLYTVCFPLYSQFLHERVNYGAIINSLPPPSPLFTGSTVYGVPRTSSRSISRRLYP
jgi:hypothetical protein